MFYVRVDFQLNRTISLQSQSAPTPSSVSTISMCPSYTAMCSGVLSTFVRASLDMPALSRILQISR